MTMSSTVHYSKFKISPKETWTQYIFILIFMKVIFYECIFNIYECIFDIYECNLHVEQLTLYLYYTYCCILNVLFYLHSHSMILW